MLPRNFQYILTAVLAVVFTLCALAHRYPHIAWLQPFRNLVPKPSEAERAKARRRSNIFTGAQLILTGFGLPIGYLVASLMFFQEITPLKLALVLAGSLFCVVLGITLIVRSRRA